MSSGEKTQRAQSLRKTTTTTSPHANLKCIRKTAEREENERDRERQGGRERERERERERWIEKESVRECEREGILLALRRWHTALL